MGVTYRYFHDTFTQGDTGAPLITTPVLLTGADLQVQDYAADLGSRSGQNTELSVGDILSYGSNIVVDLSQIWFKNHTAGSDAIISVTGWIVDNK